MTRLLPNCGMAVDLVYTHEFIKSGWEKNGAALRYFYDKCFAMRGVKEVCTDHQVWVRIEPKSRSWEGVAAEVALIDARIRKLIANPPDSVPASEPEDYS